jgi:hypothetical protein
MSAAPQVAVTWLPPSTLTWGHGGSRPQFDRYQFAGRRARAVSQESHISFSDFGSMHISRRAVQQARRLPTPDFAMDDKALGMAALKYLENRFRIFGAHGSNMERLARIDETARKNLPWMKRTLKKLLRRYHWWTKWRRKPQERRDKLAVQIAHLDTEIMLLERGVARLVTCAVWLYFRCGWNATEVAEELGLNAPGIRQWLARVRIVHDGRNVQRRSIGRPKKVRPPFTSAS